MLAHRLADIGVDVGRGDRVSLACRVDPAEEMLAGQVLALLHEAGERPVSDGQNAQLARFGLVLELQRAPLEQGVALAQCGRAEALVRLYIALIADPDMAEIEQPHDRRDRGFLVEATA